MSWIWTTLVVFALLFFLQTFLWKRNAKAKRLPPGPRGFPIFGSLHLLGKYPQRNLHKLSQKYGSIMHLRLRFVPTIVVSSPQAAELFLKTHDLSFASRPPLQVAKHIVFSSDDDAAKHVSYEKKTMTFGQYGSYWRTMRKICTLELLTNVKISSFRSMRKVELDLLIDYIKEAACSGITVDLSDKVSSLSADVTCQILFGKKYLNKEFDESGYKAIMDEALTLLGTPNLADHIPPIDFFDLQRLTKRMKTVSKLMDGFFDKIIDEHVQSKDDHNRTKDFVDVMLGFIGSNHETKYHIDRGDIKAIILDMFGAASGTSSITVEWALSELIKNPRVMKKAQKEIENVVGKNRMVEETDLDNLEYLDMVIKETLRLHPVLPLLLPRESREDCMVNGFHIPKKSHIVINAWAIGRDSSVWNNPEKFLPERFVGCDIDFHGRNFQFLPFGSGRRSCPGIQMGLTMVRLVIAQLVHCFDWELPDGVLPDDLDMTEEYSIVTLRAKHLFAIPHYRLIK
ncbi:hypothetical protein ACOSQ2_026570 [Xanthoceras sorbifolium]